MVFGGALGFVLIGLVLIGLFRWLFIRLFFVYLKWSYQLDIKYSSIGLFDIENLSINHQFFHLHIKRLHILFSFSIFVWRLPLITINDSRLKIHSLPKSTSNKKTSKKTWKKKLSYLKYVSIRIDRLQIEYEKNNISFQRISFDPTDTLRNTNSDMHLACEYVDLSIVDESSLCLLKSTWKSIEIQTNLEQRLLINANHWSIQLNHNIFDYYRRQRIETKLQKPTSNFRYIDPNFLATTTSTSSNQFFAKFDQWLEYLDNPFLDISIDNFDMTYISITETRHSYTLDTVHFSFHNSSKSSSETRHAYVANFRLYSHSTFLVHGLCQLTIFPTRIDLTCQFNEFTMQLHGDTLEELHRFLSSRSSTSSNRSSLRISDRSIDLSFQFVNPLIRLKIPDMIEWFHWQMNFCKILIRSNEYTEMKSAIELQTLAIYTSETDQETFSSSFIDDLSRRHYWNCLCYLPNANFTISAGKTLQIQGETNEIRLQLNTTVLTVLQHLQRLQISRKKSSTSSATPLEVSLQMKLSTLIICDTVPVHLCFSISTIRINRSQLELKKVLAFFDNHPTENISVTSLNRGQKMLDFRRINLQYIPTNSTIQISVLNDLTLVWSTKLHLFLFRLISSWKSTGKSVKSDQNPSTTVWNSIDFLVKTSTHVYLQLSNDCRIHMELQQFSSQFFRQNQTQMKLYCSQLFIDWQQQCSFVLQNVSFTRMIHSESLTTERIVLQKTITSLDMLRNRASFVEINSFSIRFPFDSTFNEVIEKLVNIRKWLKRLHKTNGDMSSDFLRQAPRHVVSDDVWTDLSIKINDFELTIVDDLFEVKLFQNYCLMADEYQERELREQELQRRIDEYERISQPLQNINELKRALAEASSHVYITRSQRTNYDENNQRIKRNLIRWHLRQVDLIALADQSWTGKENVLNIIHQIDADSTKIPLATTDLCTIWCRYVTLKCDEWSIHFRDFRQPLWQMQQFHLWGHICAAETTPDSLDSIRTPWVEIGEPYVSRVQVQRLLSPLKFYHDINSDIDSFLISYGPAWENTMAQFNLCLNTITPRASDPSPLLPWWDKIRLYLHGRWSFAANKMSWLYHVASSPYNDTEEMEWLWNQAYVDWTNGKITIQALSLSIKLRTGSKYDDCCVLYIPNVDARFSFNWLCAGNSNDHHAVRLFTRDAVKSWQKSEPHDSYALFRSHHLNATAKFECKDVPPGSTPPTFTVYSSTLRFCERVKNTMMSITRPTRRGRLFLAKDEAFVPPRKPLLSRHYETVEFQLILPQFRVKYVTSFARQTGAQVDCQLFNFITCQELHLINHNDGLARRAKTVWKPKMMNVNLKRAKMWLIRDANEDKDINDLNNKFDHQEEAQQQRTFFLSLDSLIYIRSSTTSNMKSTHSVLIDELKGVWNLTNRRTLFLVYERYRRNNILRSNLSNPFAKELEHLQQEKYLLPSADPSPSDENTNKASLVNDEPHHNATSSTTVTSVTGTGNGMIVQASTLASFLDQLINESQHKPSADLDPTADASVSLVGRGQCTKDDVEEHTIRIELSDSQIALRGIESGGYVIMSAAVACVDQYRHKPIWRDQQLCDKTSWHGDLQGMQYFATTIPSASSSSSTSSTNDTSNNLASILLSSEGDDITWIPRRDIRDENSLLGESSRSVIGSVATNNGSSDQQLQCIISKSNATLSYVFYNEQTQQEEETDTNIVIPPFTKPSINESNPIGESDRLLVDSFTFIHNDIQLSTNSSQYRTIMDIVNNLLLYVEPKEEGTSNKLRKVRLQIQLANNLPVLRESIRHLLERVRSKLSELRRLEREIYYCSRPNNNLDYSSDEEDGQNGGTRALPFTSEEYEQLQASYTSVKIESTKLAERLGMMCAVYKDMQLARIVKLRIASTSTKTARLERRYELYGGSITWFVKHDDGQITNAQFLLRNILYTKRYFENGTNEHSIIIGQAQVDNLLPDDRYRTILTSNCQQQHTMIRVYCKEGESVGGIAVKEHLEINVAPLVIQMTRRFSQMLMAFLFPKSQQQQQQQQQHEISNPNKSTIKHPATTPHKRRTRSAEGDEELLASRSLFYFSNGDLDAMEKRAKNTLAFQYIKIPEVSLIVSYKIRGTKEKKIGDLENAHISFPTLEYRNLTCSWHDLVLAIKSDVKTVLLSQAIRQNINLRLPFIGRSTRAQNQQLLATTIGDSSTSNPTVLYNSDTMNPSDTSSNIEQEEEEQKHKMKLVLGTKISKDLLTQLKRRKDT